MTLFTTGARDTGDHSWSIDVVASWRMFLVGVNVDRYPRERHVNVHLGPVGVYYTRWW